MKHYLFKGQYILIALAIKSCSGKKPHYQLSNDLSLSSPNTKKWFSGINIAFISEPYPPAWASVNGPPFRLRWVAVQIISKSARLLRKTAIFTPPAPMYLRVKSTFDSCSKISKVNRRLDLDSPLSFLTVDHDWEITAMLIKHHFASIRSTGCRYSYSRLHENLRNYFVRCICFIHIMTK